MQVRGFSSVIVYLCFEYVTPGDKSVTLQRGAAFGLWELQGESVSSIAY